MSCGASVLQDILAKMLARYKESHSDRCTNRGLYIIKYIPGIASHNSGYFSLYATDFFKKKVKHNHTLSEKEFSVLRHPLVTALEAHYEVCICA